MTFLEACRKYNRIVKNMRDAASAQDWDQLLELDREGQPYVDVLVRQSPVDLAQQPDDTARVLIAEIVAEHNEIAALVGARQKELKTRLQVGATTHKLEKLYGV